MIENFIKTKSCIKILEGLKRKIGIFIRTKNIFNPIFLLATLVTQDEYRRQHITHNKHVKGITETRK